MPVWPGPLVFGFARRRLPQDEDAADVMQDVLSAVMAGSYQRPKGRFQKWLVTVILNRVRKFHAAPSRRHEVTGSPETAERLLEEPSKSEEEEWLQDWQRHVLHIAAERVRQRTNPIHWDALERTALQHQPGQEVAHGLNLSLTKRIRQVVPEIREMKLEAGEGRNLVAKLGALQRDNSARYILDMSLPSRPDGKYAIAQLELTYDLGEGQRRSSGPIPLEITYTAVGNGHANAEVMKHIDEVQFKDMSDRLNIALQSNDAQTAQQVAVEMVKQGEHMGPAAVKKTKLAKQVLQELRGQGVVSRQTQLTLEDTVRTTEPPVESI